MTLISTVDLSGDLNALMKLVANFIESVFISQTIEASVHILSQSNVNQLN